VEFLDRSGVFPDHVRADSALRRVRRILPRWYHPLFNWERFSRVTNDGFFLAIEARDPRFTENGVRELLEQTGGQHITIVHED